MADETEENLGTRTVATTYRDCDCFRTANGPTTDIYSSRGATGPTEAKVSH